MITHSKFGFYTKTVTPMEHIHFIQRKILFDLLFEQSSRFTDLKPTEMESSQFMFHLKQLISEGLIKKHGFKYKLTTQGKETANKLDSTSLNMAIQTKVTTVLCCITPGQINEETQFLLYKRLKNPFYGCVGFPTQKVLWGDSIEETAIEGLKEETGLTGTPRLFAIRHYRIYSRDDLLIEDKLMYAYKFEDPVGILSPNMEGEFFWVSQKDLQHKVTKPLEEFWELIETLQEFISEKGAVSFKEFSSSTNKF